MEVCTIIEENNVETKVGDISEHRHDLDRFKECLDNYEGWAVMLKSLDLCIIDCCISSSWQTRTVAYMVPEWALATLDCPPQDQQQSTGTACWAHHQIHYLQCKICFLGLNAMQVNWKHHWQCQSKSSIPQGGPPNSPPGFVPLASWCFAVASWTWLTVQDVAWQMKPHNTFSNAGTPMPSSFGTRPSWIFAPHQHWDPATIQSEPSTLSAPERALLHTILAQTLQFPHHDKTALMQSLQATCTRQWLGQLWALLAQQHFMDCLVIRQDPGHPNPQAKKDPT